MHQLHRTGEHWAAWREARARIVADFRIKRDLATRMDEVDRRDRPNILARIGFGAYAFPWRRFVRVYRFDRRNADARREFQRQGFVGLFQFGDRRPVVEKIGRFAPADRDRINIEHGCRDALKIPRYRQQAQHMTRPRDSSLVHIGRGLPHVIDHFMAQSILSRFDCLTRYNQIAVSTIDNSYQVYRDAERVAMK